MPCLGPQQQRASGPRRHGQGLEMIFVALVPVFRAVSSFSLLFLYFKPVSNHSNQSNSRKKIPASLILNNFLRTKKEKFRFQKYSSYMSQLESHHSESNQGHSDICFFIYSQMLCQLSYGEPWYDLIRCQDFTQYVHVMLPVRSAWASWSLPITQQGQTERGEQPAT